MQFHNEIGIESKGQISGSGRYGGSSTKITVLEMCWKLVNLIYRKMKKGHRVQCEKKTVMLLMKRFLVLIKDRGNLHYQSFNIIYNTRR